MHPLHRSYAQLLKKLPVQEKTKMPYNQTPDHPRQISPDKYIQLAYLPVKRISNHRKGGNDTPAKTAASYALKETNVSMILTMGSRQGAYLESEICAVLCTSQFSDRTYVPYLRHPDHCADYSKEGGQDACDSNWKPASETI